MRPFPKRWALFGTSIFGDVGWLPFFLNCAMLAALVVFLVVL